tara:strand:+ start:1709 stop:1984 length:276 start_codon:yes stop_codon:yes gene_type:complete
LEAFYGEIYAALHLSLPFLVTICSSETNNKWDQNCKFFIFNHQSLYRLTARVFQIILVQTIYPIKLFKQNVTTVSVEIIYLANFFNQEKYD